MDFMRCYRLKTGKECQQKVNAGSTRCAASHPVTIHRQMALDPEAKAITLRLLALDDDDVVRRRVAMNPSTPESVLSGWPGMRMSRCAKQRGSVYDGPAVRV